MLKQHAQRDEIVDDVANRRLGYASQPSVHEHRLAHGHLVDQRVELRTVAEHALCLSQRPGHAVARQERVSRRRSDVARQHLERGRLAGAVDSQQTETLALQCTVTFAIHNCSHRINLPTDSGLNSAVMMMMMMMIVLIIIIGII